MIKDFFNKIINNTVKPLMKESGFNKTGLTFYKVNGNIIYLINIQKSIHNNYRQIIFYINCCIHSSDIDNKLGIKINLRPKEYECHFRKRIEHIIDSENNRFTVTLESDLEKIQADLKIQLISAINYLSKIDNTERLAELMIEKNGLHYFRELLSFLLIEKQLDLAEKLVSKLYKDFATDSRWNKIKQILIDILGKKSKLLLEDIINKNRNNIS